MTQTTDIRPSSREEAVDRRKSDAQDHVLDREEALDEGLKDSMDASDPPAATRPGDHGDPVPSSGYSKADR
ncbi:hypothetical protein ACFOKF_19780 [Sphingobium rhizovicinum]|uniref:Uncharacterized protein n=1 Tax=Sphingobium rhizovicinum TaxID=432308 RepID=A0ABV7NKW8_9SPHN